MRTCEYGCNGCDECTDYDADDDLDACAPPEFGCCLPPGECCMPGLHFPSECHTAADYELSALLGEIDRLRGEVDALRKDAARYRWIRENGDGDRWEIVFDECGRGLLQAEALDAAIDAAMKSEQSRLIGEAKE